MEKLIFGPIFFSSIFVAMGAKSSQWGKPLDLTAATSVDEISQRPESFQDKTVQIHGKLTYLCRQEEEQICWYFLGSDNNRIQIIFPKTNGEFPKEFLGKEIKVQGLVKAKVFHPEELKTYLEAVKDRKTNSGLPQRSVSVVATGAAL